MKFDGDNYEFNDFYTYHQYDATSHDLNSIKQKTMDKLLQHENEKIKRKRKRGLFPRVAAAIFIIITLSLVSSENLRASLVRIITGVHLVDKNVDKIINEKIINEVEIVPEGADESPGNSYQTKSSKMVKIENNKIVNYKSIEYISLSSITNLPVEVDSSFYKIPEFVFDHFDMALFVKRNDVGWYLKKDEVLTVEFKVDFAVNGTSPKGENVIYGYVLDGNFIELSTVKSLTHKITISAERDGVYYPCIINSALGYLKIINGTIRVG